MAGMKMTLNEQEKMYNVIQNSQLNCVIVSADSSNLPKGVIQSKRPLAPAPDRNSPVYTNSTDVRCKKKIHFMNYPSPQQPASVARRNARERNRVKQVNNGFAALRQHIPANVLSAFGATENTNGRSNSKKLSKVETLRVAVEYIKSLQRMLEDHEAEMTSKNIINAIVDNRYFPSSPESIAQYSPYPTILPTPPSSEASASPTPSHTSDVSTSSYPITTVFLPDGYKPFETKGPDDEELLDAIFSWQQSE
ncbi:hypothetical protein PPYR_07882 [Photinus pyralis]|uniref:BHLH domain-containing protein n=2 Tax=Photinus pyralis TaxID=7054 RepID=A0A5N4ARM2_PHOPY|nr:achaete-scute complex protein T3-like [Photinus pyralis]KAB0800002.1 hypothetical protein PPYR_07882 [Photinus pyralis]